MDGKGNHGPGPIPNRWLHCPRKSIGLIVNKFLAFKTPLDSKFNEQVPISCLFTPSMLLDSLKSSHKQKLSIWIDLTKTSRYYDKEEIKAAGCAYVKIECHGHEGAPTVEQTNTFVSLCSRFIQYHPLDLIGVHCTHGFNRTGFLIVAFMVENMDMSVAAAIHEFAKNRPPGIYKEDYIRELYRRYDDETETISVPPLPDWCFEEENDDRPNGDDLVNGTTSSPPTMRANKRSSQSQQQQRSNSRGRTRRLPKENALFMEGVPGVETVTDLMLVNKVHERLADLTGMRYGNFPGSQPVSMDKGNISFLSQKPYKVSWKADGTRYMMLILGPEEVYFLDRDNSVFLTRRVRFLNRKTREHLSNTLLDGEMVIDRVDDNKAIPRYLIYDMVFYEGNAIGKEPFYPIRMNAIEVEIIQPRIAAMKEGRIVRETEPFSVRSKAFFDIGLSEYLLSEKFAAKLSHAPDGLVYQPCEDPYKFGTTPEVLKWKPLSMNSIDFLLKVEPETRTGYASQFVGHLITCDGKDMVKFGEIKCTKAVKALNGKIIECKFEKNQWVLMRERTDKSFPNSFQTAKSVFASIRDPITKEGLLQYIQWHSWKDPMPPPLRRPPQKRPLST